MQFSENLRAKKQKTSKWAQIPKENLQGSLMQLWKSLDRRNKAKKHYKTIKGGPRDPCAIFRKTRTKQQIHKENRHAQSR